MSYLFASFLEFFTHIDRHLTELVQNYGVWTYLILFLIVFCETGLVIFPFLPGDSLLLAVGLLAAQGKFNVGVLALIFLTAAFAGDNTNYFIGKYLGRKLFRNPRSRIFKQENLRKTEAFFDRYGGRTIIMARFVPIVRTFAPFVAGMGAMEWHHFIGYSILGSMLWVGVCVFGGFFFGNIPYVKENFTVAMLAIIALSVIPVLIEYMRHNVTKQVRKRRAASEEQISKNLPTDPKETE